MDFGAMMFSTDYSIRPDDLAKMLEDRGFESMWVPEHTHIPADRTSPYRKTTGIHTTHSLP